MRKPCCEKTETTKGAWSIQEDQKLIDYVQKHGEGCWNSLPKAAGLRRCGKSCRLRWINYLRPDLKRGSFGEDEEDLIIRLHKLLGNRWSLIAGRLPGRTDNEVKNYWNSHLKKKILNTGTTLRPNKPRPEIKHAPDNKLVKYFNVMDDEVVDEVSSADSAAGCLVPELNLDLTLSIKTSTGMADPQVA
ncbi:hypothetical protein ACLB2K_044681 [Fragaria x ananassa]